MKERSKILITISIPISILFISLPILAQIFHYRITYQASKSMTKGLYLIRPAKSFHRNDIALFRPPIQIRSYMVNAHWIPKNSWMLKKIWGLPGDLVCWEGNYLQINNKKIRLLKSEIKKHQYLENYLPTLKGCHELQKDQYLLLSNKVKNSFDGRYFGPTNKSQILGKAYLFHRIRAQGE